MNACKRAIVAPKFDLEYERLCILQGICPLSHVTVNLKENVLDINVDKIHADEWRPILEALKVNNSLNCIAMRSYWSITSADEKKRRHLKRKIPCIRTREMTMKLINALKDCLCLSQSLDCLIIQNLPLSERNVKQLAKGISMSTSLKHLSAEKCCLGDCCFEALSMSIKKSMSLLSVNFSGCNLSWKSAEQIAEIIKYQASQRHSEAWQGSLRCRRPDLDKMHGLRRITLCNNRISDHGARILADAIKDDLWLKAIDLQQCSISGDGALILKESLAFNRSLWVLDLRRNQLIEYDLLRSIIELVMINAGGEHVEFPWKSSEETYDQFRTQRKKSPTHRLYKKTPIRTGKVRRRESMDSAFRSIRYPLKLRDKNKVKSSEKKHPLRRDISSDLQSVDDRRRSNTMDLEFEKGKILENKTKKDSNECNISKDIEDNHFDDKQCLEKIKKLQFEIEFYKLQLNKERHLRYSIKNKVSELQKENKELHEELSILKSSKEKEIEHLPLELPKIKKSDLDDENVLESIEASFQRFQQFLDMLEELGLSSLYRQAQEHDFSYVSGNISK